MSSFLKLFNFNTSSFQGRRADFAAALAILIIEASQSRQHEHIILREDTAITTHDQPITSVISHPKSSQATPRIDKGKGIATELDEDPLKRLVPASTIIRPDPDEPKEEKMKKAAEEAKLLAMSRLEVIKVVHEEAKKLGIKSP
ncbi:hypothetical protein Tco_0551792 [Tanacetum coccineum]